ncbi:MAG: nitrate ABC transporter, permease protein, partial [Bradyrhizobium sp.]
MSMPALTSDSAPKIVPTASAPTAASASVVTMTPKQPPKAERYVKMAREAAVRVVPPLIVLALFLIVWELLCRRAGTI